MTNVQFIRRYPSFETIAALKARTRLGHPEVIPAGTGIRVLQVSVIHAKSPKDVLAWLDQAIIEFSRYNEFQVYWVHASDLAASERETVRRSLDDRIEEIKSSDGSGPKYLDNFIIRFMSNDGVEEAQAHAGEDLAWLAYKDLVSSTCMASSSGTVTILRQLDLGRPPRRFQVLEATEVHDGEVIYASSDIVNEAFEGTLESGPDFTGRASGAMGDIEP